MGTLGGGNHFIELNKDECGHIYMVVHSGSRYLGKQVAEYYQQTAIKTLAKKCTKKIEETIKTLKQQNTPEKIPLTLKSLCEEIGANVPPALAYVEESLFEDYIKDMQIVQQYAEYNRKAIAESLIAAMGLHTEGALTTIHNYIDLDAMVLRKGAVSAKKGETLLIPINMKDGSLICKGKGNPDWNCSAPHGAGRLFSRTEAQKRFNLQDYAAIMEGIYTTSVCHETIDECPMAYKNMEDITKNITPTVEIVQIIKPIYNFKAKESFKTTK